MELKEYKCSSCGGHLEYDSAAKNESMPNLRELLSDSTSIRHNQLSNILGDLEGFFKSKMNINN